MKTGSTPNNAKWQVAANKAAATEFYRHDELNSIPLSGASSMEAFSSSEVSGYSDGDLGSSLQAVRDEGNIGKAGHRLIRDVITKVGVTGILAVSLFSIIEDGQPTISSLTLDSQSFSFEASSSYEASIFTKLLSSDSTEIFSQTDTISTFAVESEILISGTFPTLTEGTYTFTVTGSGLLGSSDLYSSSFAVA